MPEIDKPYVDSRVNDWLKRINNLYFFIQNTLADTEDIQPIINRTVTMHEELMQQVNMEPTEVPILDLFKNKSLLASFKPIGLWVIGANGRIDILTKKGAFILVDVAEKGADSKWEVFTPENRIKSQCFDAYFIASLINY